MTTEEVVPKSTPEYSITNYSVESEALAWLEDPRVAALCEALTQANNSMSDFQSLIAPDSDGNESALVKNAKNVRSEYESWKKNIEAEMQARALIVSQAEQAVKNINQELQQAAALKAQISKDLSNTLQALEAERRMAEAELRWEQILQSGEWTWVKSLRPFQNTAVKFMASAFEDNLHGVLNADQMGLGKTLMARATLDVIQSTPEYAERMATRLSTSPVASSVVASSVVASSVVASSGTGFGTGSMKNRPALNAILWVCPASIKVTTKHEFEKWGGTGAGTRSAIVLEGLPGVREQIVNIAYENGMILVANYEQLKSTPNILDKAWPIVVLDEAHKFKNEDTLVFKNVETVCRNAGIIYPMTGTPITNRPDEFWSILHMLTLKGKYAAKFRSKWSFLNQYCYKYDNKNLEFAHGMADRLMQEVKNMVIRRRKDEVSIDLPDKERIVRYIENGEAQTDLYNQMRDMLYIACSQDEESPIHVEAFNPLALYTRLRQLALFPAGVKITSKPDALGNTKEVTVDCTDSGKIDECINIVDELLANDEKVLIYSNYKAALDEVTHRINTAYPEVTVEKITGDVSNTERYEVQERFNDQNSSSKVLVGTILSMGTGLNLQGACSNAVFLDLAWTPGANEQAEDRLHRGGQTNTVTVYIMQAENTIDKFIEVKLAHKQGIINDVIERKELRQQIKQAIEDGLI